MPSKVLGVGDLFCMKEIKDGHMLTTDFVCESENCKVLSLIGFDYFIRHDKQLVLDKQNVADTISKMEALHDWSNNKVDSFSQNFRVIHHKKGEVILEKGTDV